MVGRELHTICPNGEDHQGLDMAGGDRSGQKIHGNGRIEGVLRSWIATQMMVKALD